MVVANCWLWVILCRQKSTMQCGYSWLLLSLFDPIFYQPTLLIQTSNMLTHPSEAMWTTRQGWSEKRNNRGGKCRAPFTLHVDGTDCASSEPVSDGKHRILEDLSDCWTSRRRRCPSVGPRQAVDWRERNVRDVSKPCVESEILCHTNDLWGFPMKVRQ